jgi:hypothetical protein
VQQLGLHRQRQLADLVEEDGAVVGLREQSLARPVGAGERALGVAEEFALDQGLGDGAAVDRDEGAIAPRREFVQAARRHALAGAALAGDQHGAVGRRDAGDQAVGVLHRRRAEGEGRLVAAHHHAPQRAVLLAQAAHGIDLFEPAQDLFVVHGLGDVVPGPGLDGIDGRVDRRKRGHHDECRAMAARTRQLDQLDAVGDRHEDIAQHHVVGRLVELGQCLGRRARTVDRIAGLVQCRGEDLANRRLVIDDQHLQLGHAVHQGASSLSMGRLSLMWLPSAGP